jgi:hypothetical protein
MIVFESGCRFPPIRSHQETSQKKWKTEQKFNDQYIVGIIIAFEQKRERRDEARTTSEP